MPEKYDPNKLWVALSEYGEGNVFAVYPQILAQLLLEDEAARQDGDTSEAEKLVLPSDKEWRLQQYFSLVALQKTLEVKDEEEQKEPLEEVTEVWAPWLYVEPFRNPNAPAPVLIKTSPGPAWDISQVLKAAQLLCKPPITVDFCDEQEMRCVYSLIYDVFRYKGVLEQAIEDVEFFGDYPGLVEHRHTTWLFLMELARRQWVARPKAEAERASKLLVSTHPVISQVETCIWDQRVHFAAAIARIRIKNRAYSLSELLPPHLREEKISACVNKETVTGWVNTFKAKKIANLIQELQRLGYTFTISKQLCAGEYRFDRVCPRFITLRPPENYSIGQTDLVKKGIIVLQEREFCEGASTLCRAIRASALTGVVAQSHASSPRCSAYLAAQLKELSAIIKASKPPAPATPELGKLVVFGAGDRVGSYVGALRDLGIDASEAPHFASSVCVLSDAVHCDTPIVSMALDGVVAVLATPPNSYSAVTDPIDLVCGRGGDLAMLEVLTESEIDVTGKERVQSILEEQKKTLKTLLSKPQIQLILYETHSAVEAENNVQVTRAVAEANRLARERHSLLKRKHRDTHSAPKPVETNADPNAIPPDTETKNGKNGEITTETDIEGDTSTVVISRPPTADVLKKTVEISLNNSQPGTTSARPIPQIHGPENKTVPKDPDKDWANIRVPNCDLFEIKKLPNLGNGLDINYILDRDGCFLSLIQRKEVIRLDAKYMIRVAEDRGLFGAGAPAQSARHKRKEAAAPAPRRRRKQAGGFEVERIAAPTYASLVRSSARRGSAPAAYMPTSPGYDDHEPLHVCPKHARRQAAADAFYSACTCDAGHKTVRHGFRRNSTDTPRSSPQSLPPCRMPFPLAIHELKLHSVNSQHIYKA